MSQNSKSTTTWEYNGHQFELDICDYDGSKRFEDGMNSLTAKTDTFPLDGTISNRVLAYDAMFRDMFNDIFGSGAGDKILGECKNIRNCDTAFMSFCEFINEQKSSNKSRQDVFLAKYGANRAQRRNSAK